MSDKILAALSIMLLVGFTMIVTVFVNEPDLWIVVVAVLAMATFDFWRETFAKKSDDDGSS